MVKKLTKNVFIKKANEIHNHKYNYEFSKYVNYMDKLEIICPEHGSFFQNANNHIGLKHGCPKCSKRHNYTTDEIILKFKEIHKDKYDYKLVSYKNNYTKINIICKLHGIFSQKPINHLHGQGCPICNFTFKKDISKFIEESNKTHDNVYDYSLVEYVNNKTKVKIICPEHGIFIQSPKCHI